MSKPTPPHARDHAHPYPAATGDRPLRPIAVAERLPELDGLRGFALAGILLANLPLFAGDPYMSDGQRAALPTAPLDAVAHTWIELLVQNKFMGLFALLFGVGSTLQLARARAHGSSGLWLHVRRLCWLLLIGCLHGWLAWSFDVLRFYALWGLLLPLFDRLRQRALLSTALLVSVALPIAWRIALAALQPAAALAAVDVPQPGVLAAFASGGYGDVLVANWFYDWYLTFSPTHGPYQLGILGRMLLGTWLARYLLCTGMPSPTVLRRLALCTLPLGLAGGAFQAGLLELPPPHDIWRSVPVQIGTLSLTLFYLAAVLLACRTRLGARWLALLASAGRMSFTNYLLQTAFGLWLFYGFLPGPALIGQVGMAALVPLSAAVYAAQVALSHLWLRHFAFGPAEWLWRSLAYGAPQPWRRAPASRARAGAISPVT